MPRPPVHRDTQQRPARPYPRPGAGAAARPLTARQPATPEPILGPALQVGGELATVLLRLLWLALVALARVLRVLARALCALARAGGQGARIAVRAVPAGVQLTRRAHSSARERSRARSQRARRPWLSPTGRYRFLLVVFVLLFLAVVGKLVDIQVLNADRYNQFGLAQRQRTIPLPAGRGAILDRNGVELAISTPQTTIWADPSKVEDPVAAAGALAPLLDVDRTVLEGLLRTEGRFVYLARQVDSATALRVTALELPGIEHLEEPKRFQPSGELAQSVLGQVDIDGNGIAGAEQLYDDTLAGHPGQLTLERSPDDATIASGAQKVDPADPGQDVVLTIDRSMQYEAERVLSDQVRLTKAKGGMAIVMRPGTGEILAMANVEAKPGTDEVAPSEVNGATVTTFEPGSVAKVITVSGVVNEGMVTPESTRRVPDQLRVADAMFKDDHPHDTERMTVHEILAQSSNVGTIMLAQEFGKEKLDEYFKRFGLGVPTALGFPGEAAGALLPPEEWSGTSIGSIPIGQGISVTALQMLAAFNVVANGGTYVPPRLVAATVDQDGTRHSAPVAPTRPVIRPEVAGQVQAMMEEVVATGTGTSAAVPDYRAAGKTGTARKPLPTGGYRDDLGRYHYVSSFAGFVPGAGSGLSIIAVIDEPTTSIYAGDVAAPVFSRLATYGLRHFHIPPA